MAGMNLQLFATPVQPTAENTHISTSFGKLLEPGLRKIFFETYDELPEQYSQIYNVQKSDKAKETDYGMGAFGDWTERASETDTVAYKKLSPGLERTYTHKAFTQGFMIGRELYDDEQYRQIDKFPKAMARSGRAKVEKDAMLPLINGFKGEGVGEEAYKIYDGKALFSATHPLLNSVSTCSNLATGVLNQENLEKAIKLMRATKDEAGNLAVFIPDTLIVPPALEYTARVLLESTNVPGSDYNDVNVVKGSLKLVVLDYLGTANGGSDTAWFIQDSKRHELNFFWRVFYNVA